MKHAPAQYPAPFCGIDEVGRGPLAGPVLAAAVILPAQLPDFFASVTDSKKLSTAKREKLFPLLLEHCQVGIGQASVTEIDEINILQATMLAMRRACESLPVRPAFAFIDGNRVPTGLLCPAEAVIGGDAKVAAIAAASIVAKVTRDRMMVELHAKHPHYNWHNNAGYGTACHIKGMDDFGITEHHRRSFAPVRERLERAA